MRLGKASAYAIFAAVCVARHRPDEWVTSHSIAESCGIPVDYLMKILQHLVRGGVIESERGPRGGFRLSKSPADTNLLEIVEASDGAISSSFPMPEPSASARTAAELVDGLCAQSAQFARTLLEGTTLRQLVDADDRPAEDNRHTPTGPRSTRPRFRRPEEAPVIKGAEVDSTGSEQGGRAAI